MDNRPGVYQLTMPNGIYVGSSVQVRRRVLRHLADLRRGIHSNLKLQRSFAKYGDPKISVLIYCDEAELLLLEQGEIDARKPSLNLSPTAGRNIGHRHSAETIARMSEAGRAAWNNRPRCVAEEQRLRISTSLKGRVFSAETKRKISAAKMGHRHSAATKAKVSASKKGRPLSPESLARRVERNAARTARRQSERPAIFYEGRVQ